MLALLAALVLSPRRILPEPFIAAPVRPVLPVEALSGLLPDTVARGSYWRQGGYVRLTYYYRLPPDHPITHQQIMGQRGFAEELTTYGDRPSPRAVRTVEGIQQMVRIIELDDSTYWPWAKIGGPAKLVAVTETPDGSPIGWHQVPELSTPPFPPGYPPAIKCLTSAELLDIHSDPIVPRTFRLSVTVKVRLASTLETKAFADLILNELPTDQWTHRTSGESTSIGLRKPAYGLYTIEVGPFIDPQRRLKSQVTLGYQFDDSTNAPRLVD